MDFGAFMDLFHNALNSANVSQFAPGDIQAPGSSPLAALGSALQSGQDPGLSPLPTPQQHRSAFLTNILPQLVQSIGQGNMLGRMGGMQ